MSAVERTPGTGYGTAPGNTPSDAMESMMTALARGDDRGFRGAVVIRSPHGYSAAHCKWLLAGARLRTAIRERAITGQRRRPAGWDRDQKLSPNIANAPASWTEPSPYRKIGWIVEGDVARPVDGSLMHGTYGRLAVKRTNGRWTVVISDPDGEEKRLKKYAQAWIALADATEATRSAVKDGQLTTIREVNDFFDAELAKREGHLPAPNEISMP